MGGKADRAAAPTHTTDTRILLRVLCKFEIFVVVFKSSFSMVGIQHVHTDRASAASNTSCPTDPNESELMCPSTRAACAELERSQSCCQTRELGKHQLRVRRHGLHAHASMRGIFSYIHEKWSNWADKSVVGGFLPAHFTTNFLPTAGEPLLVLRRKHPVFRILLAIRDNNALHGEDIMSRFVRTKSEVAL